MGIGPEVLSEAYLILKQYIPAKDRQEAADNLMGMLVDMLSDDELKEFGNTDTVLRHALKEYSVDDDDDDDEYNEE